MRKKALSVISILMIIICLLPTIACSELRNDNFSNDSATKQVGRVLQDEKQDSAEDESDTVVVQSQEGFTSSSYETLSGVSPNRYRRKERNRCNRKFSSIYISAGRNFSRGFNARLWNTGK